MYPMPHDKFIRAMRRRHPDQTDPELLETVARMIQEGQLMRMVRASDGMAGYVLTPYGRRLAARDAAESN